MAIFEIKAKHTVPIIQLERGSAIDAAELDEMRKHPDFQQYGCYVYSIAFPTGAMPIYVGKAQDQCFSSRTFSADNRLRVQNSINDYQRKYPLAVWLVAQQNNRGAPNKSEIDHIECWLIYKATERNPDGLLNKHRAGFNPHDLKIAHILTHIPPGRTPNLVVEFKNMMGLD